MQPMLAAGASWDEETRVIEGQVGARGLALFFKAEHNSLLALAGKTSRANQYKIGNPLLAVQMTRLVPEAALYAPLSLVVYEDEAGNTFVAYDSFVLLLDQYQREDINAVAQQVEQKVEALVATVTGTQANSSSTNAPRIH